MTWHIHHLQQQQYLISVFILRFLNRVWHLNWLRPRVSAAAVALWVCESLWEESKQDGCGEERSVKKIIKWDIYLPLTGCPVA